MGYIDRWSRRRRGLFEVLYFFRLFNGLHRLPWTGRSVVKARNVYLLPRLIRLRDAPGYLGMDRNRFKVWGRC
jgi:hypothetical protein